MLRVCFTGHRPNKLGGYNWDSAKNIEIMDKINDVVKNLIILNQDKEFYFITGGALGTDQVAFKIVNELKGVFEDITITQEISVPFEKQPKAWFDKRDIDRYNTQLSMADKITYVDKLERYKCKNSKIGEYSPSKMQLRNMYMVDNSDIVIAVWNGDKKGGTWNCIKYARNKNKKIVYIYV